MILKLRDAHISSLEKKMPDVSEINRDTTIVCVLGGGRGGVEWGKMRRGGERVGREGGGEGVGKKRRRWRDKDEERRVGGGGGGGGGLMN